MRSTRFCFGCSIGSSFGGAGAGAEAAPMALSVILERHRLKDEKSRLIKILE